MAYVTPIGSNPEQVEYRLGGGHGCGGPGGGDRQFSYHADGRERPLRWIGAGLGGVGLRAGDELTTKQFDVARGLMDGRDPATGESLVQAKRGIPDDAKVSLAVLVRAIEAVAAEADVTVAEVLGNHAKSLERFERAQRLVQSRGEAARLRADHAGELADRAGIPVEEIWGEEEYAEAVGNLWETVTITGEDGTKREEQRPRRVVTGNAGYDITFTLPKSFSLLLAFAGAGTAADIEAAFMRQVEANFAWLESQVAYGMRGEHGNGKTATTTPGEGLLGWTMVHRAARPTNDAEIGDPHWHVHLTVANMVRSTEDGQWSTIAAGGRDLMRHIPAVDHLLKATVRHELQSRFGVRFARNERSDAWELVGIPDETLRHFSKRHHDIKEMLVELGYDDEEATRAQDRIAEQRSRGAKGESVAAADATLQQMWQGEELDAGRDPVAQIRAVFGRPGFGGETGGPPDLPPDPQHPEGGGAANPGVDEIAAQLLDPETGLTAHSRRFSRVDALRRAADALPRGAASIAEIERITDAVLSRAGYLHLPGTGAGVQGPNGARSQLGAAHMANAELYTTSDVVDAETVILRAARASQPGQLRTTVDEGTRDLAVSLVDAQQDHPLAPEQRDALTRLVGEGRAIATVNGAPGTGKTTLMRALRVVHEAAGHVLAGAATAAVAAQNLETESGITSRTVASWLHAIDERQEPLRGVDVLVLDEANLTEDRDRARLYLHAAATGTQVVEIGDSKQLRGVGVGSLFGRVHELVEGPELTHNRRQAEEDERAAVSAWRAGRYAEAYAIWQGRGELVITDQASETTAAMLRHWWDQRRGAPDAHTEMRGLVMLAATNAQVRRLNAAAQAMRLTEGELGAHRRYAVAGGEQLTLHVGDHVLLRVNDRAGYHVRSGPGVLNGYRAQITELAQDGTVAVTWQHETADGERITETARLDPSYVAAGGVELGYAMTVHKSEGLTVKDQWDSPDGAERGGTVLFHTAGAENPSAHVATSRHRRAVYVFGSLEELESEQDRYLLGAARTPEERDARAIDKLAQRARDTAEHGDDRPVVVDLGLAEFLSEQGRWQRTAEARDEYAAERAEREQQRADREQRRAERAQRRAERAEAADRRRTGAELLIREVWRHEPSLVEVLLADAAFDAFARNLADAAEAGFDVREVLAEIPLDRLGADRITDKARFAAWGVTNAVERLRTGAAQRDYDARVEREGFDLAREQVADLLDEMWQRPELVERIAEAGAFDHLVRAFDLADEVGLDARGIAEQIDPRRLERDSVRDPAAMATYLVRQVTARSIAERDEAERHAAAQQERAEQQAQVAERLREVWQHADPDAVERIISGPSFGHLVDRITGAEADGWDVEVLLGGLDPDALAAAPSPSGAATFGLSRAVEQAEAAEQERLRAEANAAPLSEQTSARLLDAARAWTARPNQPSPADQAASAGDADAQLSRLAEVTAAAAQFYADQLDAHPAVRDYLHGRFGDLDRIRDRFTLGYAPDGWRTLTNHLHELGFSEQELLDAGVAKESRGGRLIDRMRGRVLVGIRDEHGRVAGFSGRPPHERYDKSQVPKYLNTPTTRLFDKGSAVFGLYEQRAALAAGGVPVLVEGTMDVLALAAADPQQQLVPIASSGTAVTEAHLAAVRAAGGQRLVLALDGDTAGQAAAERTAGMAVRALDEVRVVTLPDGADPNEWAQRHAAQPDAVLRPFLDHAAQQSAGDFLADRAVEGYFALHPPQHRDEVEGQLAAADRAAAALRDVPPADAISTGARIGHELNIDPGHMVERLARHRLLAAPEPTGPVQLGPESPAPDQHEPESAEGLAVEDLAEPSQVELDAAGPAESAPVEPEVLDDPGAGAAAVEIADWRSRPFGELSDERLHDRLAELRGQLDRDQLQLTRAESRAGELQQAVNAEQGPHVAELDAHQADMRERAELAQQAEDVAEQRRQEVDAAADAAAERARAEWERDRLGRFAARRRAELDERIAEQQQREDAAQRAAAEHAERLATLQQRTGDAAERRRTLTRARGVERDDEFARPRAQQRDAQELERAQRQLDRTREQTAEREQQVRQLEAETQVRAALPVEVATTEQAERIADTAAEVTAQPGIEHAVEAEQQVALEQQRDLGPEL